MASPPSPAALYRLRRTAMVAPHSSAYPSAVGEGTHIRSGNDPQTTPRPTLQRQRHRSARPNKNSTRLRPGALLNTRQRHTPGHRSTGQTDEAQAPSATWPARHTLSERGGIGLLLLATKASAQQRDDLGVRTQIFFTHFTTFIWLLCWPKQTAPPRLRLPGAAISRPASVSTPNPPRRPPKHRVAVAKLWVHDKRAIQVIALIEPVFHLLLGVCLAHFLTASRKGRPKASASRRAKSGTNPGCRRDGMQVTQRTFAASGHRCATRSAVASTSLSSNRPSSLALRQERPYRLSQRRARAHPGHAARAGIFNPSSQTARHTAPRHSNPIVFELQRHLALANKTPRCNQRGRLRLTGNTGRCKQNAQRPTRSTQVLSSSAAAKNCMEQQRLARYSASAPLQFALPGEVFNALVVHGERIRCSKPLTVNAQHRRFRLDHQQLEHFLNLRRAQVHGALQVARACRHPLLRAHA